MSHATEREALVSASAALARKELRATTADSIRPYTGGHSKKDVTFLKELAASCKFKQWTNNKGWKHIERDTEILYGVVSDTNRPRPPPNVTHRCLAVFMFEQVLEDGKLVEINLQGNQLHGVIPASIKDCEFLRRVCLHDNDLLGPIPAGLSELTGVTWINLSNNQLRGTIPHLGNLEHLKVLNLESNYLTGKLENWLLSLHELWSLQLGNNKLKCPACHNGQSACLFEVQSIKEYLRERMREKDPRMNYKRWGNELLHELLKEVKVPIPGSDNAFLTASLDDQYGHGMTGNARSCPTPPEGKHQSSLVRCRIHGDL